MSIKVQRVGELYEAEATPPHVRLDRWQTPSPMTASALIDTLRELGCHTTDITDALYEADPEWVDRPEPPK